MSAKSEPTLLEATAALLKAAEVLSGQLITTPSDLSAGVEWGGTPTTNATAVAALNAAIGQFYTLYGAARFPELDDPTPAEAAAAPAPPADWWVSDGEGFTRSATLGGALAVYLTLFQPDVDLEDHIVITDPHGGEHPVTLPDDFDPDDPWGEAEDEAEADDEAAV